jgi:hypothetical protein
MKPILKRKQQVEIQSRLYESKYPGSRYAPGGTIGTVVDFEGMYYGGVLIAMVAVLKVTVSEETFFVKVNERSVKLLP